MGVQHPSFELGLGRMFSSRLIRLVIQLLDSCAMADDLAEASGLLSVSVLPEHLALSSGLGAETLSLFSSETSSGSSSVPGHPILDWCLQDSL
jgi:hypothetical protein